MNIAEVLISQGFYAAFNPFNITRSLFKNTLKKSNFITYLFCKLTIYHYLYIVIGMLCLQLINKSLKP